MEVHDSDLELAGHGRWLAGCKVRLDTNLALQNGILEIEASLGEEA